MGIMTLALSAFSIIPMAISFVHRVFLAQVVTHLLNELDEDDKKQGGSSGMSSPYLSTFSAKKVNPSQLGAFNPHFEDVQSHRCLCLFELTLFSSADPLLLSGSCSKLGTYCTQVGVALKLEMTSFF